MTILPDFGNVTKRPQTRKQKGAILDEICVNLGYRREHACRIMNAETSPRKVIQYRSKSVKYDKEVQFHVGKLWRFMNRPGGRKMRAAMVDWLPFYVCPQHVKQLLYKVSPAQIDRILKPIREEFRRKNNTGTRRTRSKIITEVPIRPLGKVITELGHIEADTVARCGESLAGKWVWKWKTEVARSFASFNAPPCDVSLRLEYAR